MFHQFYLIQLPHFLHKILLHLSNLIILRLSLLPKYHNLDVYFYNFELFLLINQSLLYFSNFINFI